MHFFFTTADVVFISDRNVENNSTYPHQALLVI